MKIPPIFLAACSAFFFAINTSYAQGIDYQTDFYTNNSGYTYTPNTSIYGQDGWYSPNGNPNGPGVVANLNFLGQANSFTLGGSYYSTSQSDINTYPVSPDTYTAKTFALNDNSVRFDSIFFVNPGISANKDTFRWTLFNTAGFQLISIDLNPVTINGATKYSLGATSWANDSDLSSQSLKNLSGNDLTDLNANTWYHLGFEVLNIGTSLQSINVYSYSFTSGLENVPVLIGSTTINYYDFSASDYNNGDTNIGIFANTWTLANTATGGTNSLGQTVYPNYGDNTLVMNTLRVSSVPEPSAWAMLGVASVVFGMALRRRTVKN
jgi:hypothetical protein